MGAAALGSWGAEGRCLHARWTCLPQLLVLPWLPNKPSPFSTRQPLILRPGLSRDLGSWVSWKRFPGTHSGLPHWLAELAGKGHPRGHF